MVNNNVAVFFVVGTLSFAWLAFRFLRASAPAFRNFGTALTLFAVAFATWSGIILVHPSGTELAQWTSIGVAPFGLAMIFFVAAATVDFTARTRRILLTVAAAVLALLYSVRTWIFPSEPAFSEQGLFYFNADPVALLLYVIVFAGAVMPAVHVVTSHIADAQTAMFTRIFFNVVTLSAVVLLVSTSDELQYWNGWLMLIGLAGLVATHSRRSPGYVTH